MIQMRPNQAATALFEIPPAGAGGLFKSGLGRRLDLKKSPTSTVGVFESPVAGI